MSACNQDLTQEESLNSFGYSFLSTVHSPCSDDTRANECIRYLSQLQDSIRISEDVFSRMRDLLICCDPLVIDVVEKYKKGDVHPLDDLLSSDYLYGKSDFCYLDSITCQNDIPFLSDNKSFLSDMVITDSLSSSTSLYPIYTSSVFHNVKCTSPTDLFGDTAVSSNSEVISEFPTLFLG